MPTRLHKRFSQLITLAAALIIVTPAYGKENLTLHFGVVSTDDLSAVVRKYMPALKVLEKSMTEKLDRTVDIRMQIVSEQEQGISHLSQSNVDFTALNNPSYLKAKLSNPDIRILAARNSMYSTTLTPWVARAGMQDSVFIALRASLLDISNSKILTNLRTFGFVQSHDSQYEKDIDNNKITLSVHKRSVKNKRLVNLSGKQVQAIEISKPEPVLSGASEALMNIENRVLGTKVRNIIPILKK